jgi:hypothetical protein
MATPNDTVDKLKRLISRRLAHGQNLPAWKGSRRSDRASRARARRSSRGAYGPRLALARRHADAERGPRNPNRVADPDMPELARRHELVDGRRAHAQGGSHLPAPSASRQAWGHHSEPGTARARSGLAAVRGAAAGRDVAPARARSGTIPADPFEAVIRPQMRVRGARLVPRPLRMLRGVYPAKALAGLGLQAR